MRQRSKNDDENDEDEDDDSFSSDDEYFPNSAIPTALPRPASALPTPNSYKILNRDSDERGVVFYLIQAEPDATDEPQSDRRSKSRDSRESEPRRSARPAESSSSASVSSGAPRLPRFRIPLTKILDFVSPLQLERFEHSICRRPDLDPYLRRLREREEEELRQQLALFPPSPHGEQAAEDQDTQQETRRRGRPPKRQRLAAPAPPARMSPEESRVAMQSIAAPPAIHLRKSSLTLPIAAEPQSESEEGSIGDVAMVSHEDDDAPEWEVEGILNDAVVDGEQMYLVRWAGFSDDESTWEREGDLEGARDLLGTYLLKKIRTR